MFQRGAASSAQAAGGYERCAWGQVCVFSGPVGTGDMMVVTSSLPSLGAWDNRISSLANYSDYTVCVSPDPDFGWYGAVHYYTGSRVSFDESTRPDLDEAVSSIQLLPNAEDCGNFSTYPFWWSGKEPAPRPASSDPEAAFGDFDGLGRTDLVGRNRYGMLWALSADEGTDKARRIGTAWDGMTQLVRHGDYNGDGKEDLYARDSAGTLWFYPGLGTGGFGNRLGLGGGWNSMNQLVSPGDVSGDGRADLLARDDSRQLWLYPGNGAGSFGDRTLMPYAWPSDSHIVATGDGIVDLMRPITGQAFVYPGTGNGGLRSPQGSMPWDGAPGVLVF
ncbi:FG-GAP-like repeat-containing protein [Streptomyces sp. NBC_00503]|uniref:FG-GAP-like repeat-containing protein n=1 Tax=Streptomyces sp. NBC_00503 TaxID=2903659 RepID=UPI002E820569|nr:FG-GAP-like repeat-containing protein [Streptomyces sp. NBC_00503]WUD81922.1 FG-GAP-like repeat-containing protein [Streptomyces sp. NBC_00503]